MCNSHWYQLSLALAESCPFILQVFRFQHGQFDPCICKKPCAPYPGTTTWKTLAVPYSVSFFEPTSEALIIPHPPANAAPWEPVRSWKTSSSPTSTQPCSGGVHWFVGFHSKWLMLLLYWYRKECNILCQNVFQILHRQQSLYNLLHALRCGIQNTLTRSRERRVKALSRRRNLEA